jgi:hypothetical protein
MKNFRTVFNAIRLRPGMYLQEPTYDAICALVQGYDLACDGGTLVGFREWLITRLSFGNNLTWSALVLHSAFPKSSTPHGMCGISPENAKHAIDILFQLIFEFDDTRQKPDGLRRIYSEYECWLRTQEWYRPGSPGWIG